MTALHRLSSKLDELIQFERGDQFFNKLHPDVLQTYFGKNAFRVGHSGLQAPSRGSELSKESAKLLRSTRLRIKPSDMYGQYSAWRRATGNIPMRRAA